MNAKFRLKYRFVALAFLLLQAETSWAKVYQSFAGIAEKVIPGVVNIRTTQMIANREAWLDPYQFFLRGRLPQTSKTHSLGSGIVISPNGYILTNHHVIKHASKIDVLLAKSKKSYTAKIIGIDQKTDLALLKIKSKQRFYPLDFADSDKLRVGDIVLAVGNPFGFAHTVTSGIISAKGRVIGTGPFDSYLQTDASIHPGNSGGPLIDIRGRVVGINTAVSSEGHGIGFALPANLVQSVVRDLKKYGKVIRPWLGVVGRNILSTDQLEEDHDPAGVYGVLVDNLIVDGPAYKAGLRIGDLIMGLDQHKILDMNDLQRQLSDKSPADVIRLKIYRRGRGFVQIKIRLSVIPSAQELPEEKDLF